MKKKTKARKKSDLLDIPPEIVEKYLAHYDGDGLVAAAQAGVPDKDIPAFLDRVMGRQDILKAIINKLSVACRSIERRPDLVQQTLSDAGISLKFLAERLYTIINSEPICREEYNDEGKVIAREFAGYRDHLKGIEICYRLLHELSPEYKTAQGGDEESEGTGGQFMGDADAVIFYRRPSPGKALTNGSPRTIEGTITPT